MYVIKLSDNLSRVAEISCIEITIRTFQHVNFLTLKEQL